MTLVKKAVVPVSAPHCGHRNVAPRTPQHARFAARMRKAMEEQGYTRASLAREMGVTPTMVGYWRAGRYLPPLPVAAQLAEVLDDGKLRSMVVEARTVRCGNCGKTFDREQTRATYCSPACQRRAHLKGGTKFDPRQEAIDDMCRGCEPEGICRDDSCALRPFSPFLFTPARRIA